MLPARQAAALPLRLPAGLPIALLVLGAAVPALRPAVLAALVVGSFAITGRGGLRWPGGRAWLATLPAAAGLTWASLADTPMPLPDSLHCIDPLSPRTAARSWAGQPLRSGSAGRCSGRPRSSASRISVRM